MRPCQGSACSPPCPGVPNTPLLPRGLSTHCSQPGVWGQKPKEPGPVPREPPHQHPGLLFRWAPNGSAGPPHSGSRDWQTQNPLAPNKARVTSRPQEVLCGRTPSASSPTRWQGQGLESHGRCLQGGFLAWSSVPKLPRIWQSLDWVEVSGPRITREFFPNAPSQLLSGGGSALLEGPQLTDSQDPA